MKNQYFVVIQAGGPAYGFGDTAEEAIEDAQEWIDEDSKGKEIAHIKWTPEYNEASMHGELVVAECSADYYQAAVNDGTVIYDFIDGMIVLDDDQ